MSITVKYKGRTYVWHKSKKGWYTDKNRRVTSATLEQKLDQATCDLKSNTTTEPAREPAYTVSEYIPRNKADVNQQRKRELREKGHICADHLEYYEFIENGYRFHGYSCKVCGEVAQTG